MKIALIGCGFFARNHLHAWSAIDGASVVALCDTDPERLNATGDAFGIARRHTDAIALYDEGGFDVVDIATTAPSHRALVTQAAQNGVHAICQKPFATTLPDANAMVAAMRDADRTLMVHENFRWQAPVRTVIDRLRAGVIGEPFFARVSFRSGYDVFAGQPYLAEGARFIIEDLGIHILDIARALMGEVTQLSATTQRINPAIKGEDVATMLLAHAGGATSIVDCSYATRRTPETFPQTLIEVDGTGGTLRLDAGFALETHVGGTITREDLSPKLLPWAERPWHVIQDSVLRIQQHFVQCLHDGTPPETSGADNLRTLALVEAAYQSAAQGRTLDPASL